MKTRLVTFDAGNTLVYAWPSVGEIYSQVTARFGARIGPSNFLEAFGAAYREGAAESKPGESERTLWERITRGIHGRIPDLGCVPFDDWFDALYDRFGSPEVWRVFDDVVPALSELKKRGPAIGLISNWDRRLRGILSGLGLLPHFDIVEISSEAGSRKPDSGMFDAALAQAGVAPHEAVHVGDLLDEDVRGAVGAGWRAVLIDRTGCQFAADGARVVRSLGEILHEVQL